jgi:hypothetical protein
MIVSKYRSIEVTSDNIKSKVPDNIILSDIIISFNYNGDWIIIPLTLLVKYPIIYFLNEETKEYGSIVCCLLTLRTMYVYEKVRWVNYNGLEALFNNESGESMSFETKLDKNGNKIVEFKRSQTKIQTLRSALIEYGDLKYLYLDIPEKKSNLIPFDYYSNLIDYNSNELTFKKYHPKTLCLMIQYQSDNEKNNEKNNVKTSIIIPKKINNNIIGYEPRKDGLDQYLALSTDKLIEKKAFILNIMYYAAEQLYKNSKFISL